MVLVLLPPSEGKAGAGDGGPLEVGGLSLPGLTGARERVLDAVVALCSTADAAAEERALGVLGLSPGQRGELPRNARLRTAPTLRAAELYTGVLYDALGLGSLEAGAYRRAEQALLICSGLWGVLRIADRVPPYRCSMGVKGLPGVGPLAGYWRGPLGAVLPEVAGDGLVLDLRSSAYAAVWKPGGEVAGRTATVRVLHERVVNGVTKRSVVSHFNKATKGRLLRALLEDGAQPGGPAELVTALRDLKYTVEATEPARAGRPWALDVVVSEL